jgi:predicted nucleotide-binding protein (sugar kinase/HSP70/actin superfamily)
MAIKIGIPRALMYYQYYPLWKTFFEALGGEVVLSPKTNKEILNKGSLCCVAEACLPVKVFHGHAASLIGKVDFIFIPRLLSVKKKEYICPKIGGLPDMVRYSVDNLPRIIDTEVNLRKGYRSLKKSFLDAGSYLTPDKKKILSAGKKALASLKEYATETEEEKKPKISEGKSRAVNIALIGHAYNLYDKYVNLEIIKKLADMDVSVYLPETLTEEDIEGEADTLDKRIFWTTGRKMMGSALMYSDKKAVDGLIYLMSFGCGVDSFIADLIEKKMRAKSVPFFSLSLDEQTGEAGLLTRLEAFTDMLKRRKRNACDVPSYR